MTRTGQILKRLADLVIVICASPLILVLYVVIAILVLLTSGRPVLFRQQRAGLRMKPFNLYKFRSMRRDCDPYGNSPKSQQDKRLTPIGRWLRRTSLDELPQFWNVLIGDMSLVGPRPLYLSQAKEWNQRQKRRLEVKPGLTGLAQVHGRGGLTIEEKLELDVQYVERQSLALDFRIFLATFLAVLQPDNIYEKRYSHDHETRPK